MMRVRLFEPLAFNLTGYDREAVQFPAGEQDVPDVVASFVRRNPAVGEIIEAAPLPADFPGHAALAAAGIEAVEDVPREMEALVTIDGIGTKTAGAILEALA